VRQHLRRDGKFYSINCRSSQSAAVNELLKSVYVRQGYHKKTAWVFLTRVVHVSLEWGERCRLASSTLYTRRTRDCHYSTPIDWTVRRSVGAYLISVGRSSCTKRLNQRQSMTPEGEARIATAVVCRIRLLLLLLAYGRSNGPLLFIHPTAAFR